MKVIPAIDIIGGKTVRLVRGSYSRKMSYTVHPVDAAREWESCGAGFLHVVDLDGAKAGKPVNLDVAEQIAKSVDIPVELGGGYRKVSDIKKALDKGIWRIIIGSKAIEEPEFAREVIKSFKSRVILSVDADKEKLKTRGWERSVGLNIFEMVEKFKAYGAKEMIYTDISRDGTLSGPDAVFLKKFLIRTKIKCVYAGGIKTLAHIKKLKKLSGLGLTGVVVGRSIYDGTLDLEEAVNACEEDNTVS
jgi:phosphoribosylformimino-5-aminoimidazole carboxamide ribotide isomerase